MAKMLYGLVKSEVQGEIVIDGVRAALITLDGSFTDADIRALAVAQLNARVNRAPFPASYFDRCAPLRLSDFTAIGPLKNHGDTLMIGARAIEKIPG